MIVTCPYCERKFEVEECPLGQCVTVCPYCLKLFQTEVTHRVKEK